jgi:predicted house-cleaning NTP pyrophosphatase (Maf/HAM1 superfamily)
VRPSTIDEKSIRDTNPAALRKKLTEAKARKVARASDGAVVASGDAVVAKDTKLFEKPRSNGEAVEFLRKLSDSAFHFVTSLTPCFVPTPAECSPRSKLPRSNSVA